MDSHPQPSPFADKARWTTLALAYERWGESFTGQYSDSALSLAGGVQPGERVLDVAAGTGALALRAGKAGAHVLATDFSPGMVERLGERLAPFIGCAASVMDGQALAIEDASFDASFSMFGVMAFPDYRRGLAELVRATRAGGRTVVATWANPDGAGPMAPFMQAYRATFPDAELPPPLPGVIALSSAEDFKAEMIAAGCDDVVVHEVDGVWGGPSLDMVMATFEEARDLIPLYAALDDAGRAKLAGPLRAAIAAHVDPDRAIRVHSIANIAIGRKHR